MRRLMTSAAALLLPLMSWSQIVTDWNQDSPVITSWEEKTAGKTEEDDTGFEEILDDFKASNPESVTEETFTQIEGLPEISTRRVSMMGREIDLPSMILPDGTDIYLLLEEGIQIYLSLNPPAFYEDLDPDTIRWIRFYAHTKKAYTKRLFKKYEGWQEYVEDCMRERKIPSEIGLLCMIESGCRADAVSRVGAVGMWQFMPDAAMEMGLKISPAEDERTNPYKATKAAAKYLAAAFRQTGSWTMAAASYNCGTGRTQNIIRKNKTTEWSKIRNSFPSETRQYVPSLIALYYVWTYRKELGF